MASKVPAEGRVPVETDDQDAALRSIECVVQRLVLTVKSAIQNRELLDAANGDDELIALFKGTYEELPLGAIQVSLIQSLLLRVIRCWDHKGNELASLFRLAMMLREAGVVHAFAERAAGWNPGFGPQAAERNRAFVLTRLPDLLDRIAQKKHGEAEKRLKRLHEYRNIFIAHDLVKPISDADKPKFDDIFETLQKTTELVEEAQLLCLGIPDGFNRIPEIHARRAKSFWAVLKAGQRISRQSQ